MIWSIVNTLFLQDFSFYVLYLQTDVLLVYFYVVFPMFGVEYPPSGFYLTVFSFVLAVLLIVSLVLSGVGFYGVYRRGGGGAGVLALIAAITGGTLGATLTTLGNITGNHSIIPCFCSNGGTYFFNLPVYVGPNYLFVWVGMLVVAVTFILLGSASIAVRASTATPSVALKAGIISIIGACFLGFPPIPWLWFFWLLAFTLMLVAFVLWTVVFYSSREAIF